MRAVYPHGTVTQVISLAFDKVRRAPPSHLLAFEDADQISAFCAIEDEISAPEQPSVLAEGRASHGPLYADYQKWHKGSHRMFFQTAWHGGNAWRHGCDTRWSRAQKPPCADRMDSGSTEPAAFKSLREVDDCLSWREILADIGTVFVSRFAEVPACCLCKL